MWLFITWLDPLIKFGISFQETFWVKDYELQLADYFN
jgi:hypothetical protein